MNNLILLKTLQRCLRMQSSRHVKRQSQSTAGFTLIEMLVVVIIVGILSAIVAPSWLTFTNKQRVNKVNDAVFAALQQAQGEAKSKKFSYSVSFKKNTNSPNQTIFAVYRKGNIPSPDSAPAWKPLGGDLNVQSEQIWFATNITSENQAGTTAAVITDTITVKTITFDYNGTLSNANLTDLVGLKVVVAVPVTGNPTNFVEKTKRCVIVQTLIGGMRTAKDDNCN